MTATRNRSKEHQNSRNDWGTPVEVFNEIQDFLGVVGLPRFTLDVAASEGNTKCEKYYTFQQNALEMPWETQGLWWCNPPFNELEAFMEKATIELLQGREGIMLLPNNPETKHFRRLITDANRPRLMWPRRISFVWPEDNKRQNGNTIGSWIVAFFSDKSIKKLKGTGNRLAGQPFTVSL